MFEREFHLNYSKKYDIHFGLNFTTLFKIANINEIKTTMIFCSFTVLFYISKNILKKTEEQRTNNCIYSVLFYFTRDRVMYWKSWWRRV